MKRFLVLSSIFLAFVMLINNRNLQSQTDVIPNADDFIIWHEDSAFHGIDFFPLENGNIIVEGASGSTYGPIYEVNGFTGELIRELPVTQQDFDNNLISDVSRDGKYISFGGDNGYPLFLYDVDNDTTILEIESSVFARFSPDSRTVVYSHRQYDSSIVFHDILTGEREYIKRGIFETANDILAFSNDGRYFATAGWSDNTGKDVVSFKLWDAETRTLIKELYRFDNSHTAASQIEFSKDGKIVGFRRGVHNTYFFDLQSYELIKTYDYHSFEFKYGVFSIINQNWIVLHGENISFVELGTHNKFDLIETEYEGYSVFTNFDKSILYTSSTQLPSFRAWNINEIFASSVENENQNQLKVTYSFGILNIEFPEKTSNYSINILNLNGQLMANFNENSNSRIIEKNIDLHSGVYYVEMRGGSKVFTGKFVVAE